MQLFQSWAFSEWMTQGSSYLATLGYKMKRLRRWATSMVMVALALGSALAVEKPAGWPPTYPVPGRQAPTLSIEQAIVVASKAIREAKLDVSYEYLAGAKYIADRQDVPDFLKLTADGPFWHIWFQDPKVRVGEEPARDRHSVLVFSATRTALATDRLKGAPEPRLAVDEVVANGKPPGLAVDQAVAIARKAILQQKTQIAQRFLAGAKFTPDASFLPAEMAAFADGPFWHIWFEDPEAPHASEPAHTSISVLVYSATRASIVAP
jgi:hypothetical protein